MYKKAFLFIIFLLGFSFICFAQGKAAPESNLPEARKEEPAKLVTAIEIVGNKSISNNTIVSKMKTHIGSPYQDNIISDDLRRLYLLGYFEDIKIDNQDYNNGIKVIVTVKERPIIDKISFSGILRLTTKDEKLKEQLKSKEKQYLDYPNLSEDVKIIEKMYEKIGYSKAAVTYQVIPGKEDGRVNVQFNIVESKRVSIKNIIIEGNKSFSRNRILKLMKTKIGWLFNAGVYKEEVVKEDIERLKSFYRRQGFSDVDINYEVTTDTKKPYWLYINIRINEGKKYVVGSINIQGNTVVKEKDILAKITECKSGDVFSDDGMKQDIANIQSIYFDRGYISAQVQEIASVNKESGRVDITYNISENELVYVEKIKIKGNVKTKDVVVRRELRIYPGDKFDGEKLKRSKERLQNLGFFEEVNYDTEETDQSNKKDLIVDVKESKTGTFSFGGGYSTVDQFVGFVEIEQRNFDWKNFPYFTGAGQNLKFRASIGNISNDFDLSFTEPWMFDYPVSFGFDVYRRTHKRATDVGYGYDEKVTGGALRLGKEISDYVSGSITYRNDNIDISNISDDASNDLKSENGKNTISSMTFGLNYDNRDNVFDPMKGNVLSSSFECAGGPFAGKKDYLKLYGLAAHYTPAWIGSNFEFKGQIGLATPYSNSNKLPLYERYFAGGANTIRGYRERKVGPIDPASSDPLGGNALAVGNIEYHFPVFSFMKLAAFYDIGNVWAKVSNMNSGGFKSGMGLGFRLKTPIGPLTLDYGIPLNKEPGEEKKGPGRLHFSASHGF